MTAWSRLARVEGPQTLALSLEAAKAHLNLQGIDDHDAAVQGFIADAIAAVEGPDGIGVCLITQTWRLSLDAWPREIRIPLGPVQSVEAITYLDPAGDAQTLAADQYAYDADRRPFRILPAEGVTWPSLKAALGVVKVRFKAGYGDAADAIPGNLIGALKLIVGHRFEHRGDDVADAIPQAVADVFEKYRRGRAA
jgi:uncharacterized phiE125 gp8 family phage protein